MVSGIAWQHVEQAGYADNDASDTGMREKTPIIQMVTRDKIWLIIDKVITVRVREVIVWIVAWRNGNKEGSKDRKEL